MGHIKVDSRLQRKSSLKPVMTAIGGTSIISSILIAGILPAPVTGLHLAIVAIGLLIAVIAMAIGHHS